MVKLEDIKEIILAIRKLPDPFAWADSFRQSFQKYRKGSDLKELARDCKELRVHSKITSAFRRADLGQIGSI